MATTKLRLRNDRTSFGKTTVYVQYTFKSRNYYFSTKEKIDPAHWHARLEKVSGNAEEIKALNSRLQAYLADINQLVAGAIHQKLEPTPAYLREQLSSPTGSAATLAEGTPTATPNFLALFDAYITATQATKAHGTIKHYRTTLNHLTAFAAQKRRPLTLDAIDTPFYHAFVTFLTKELRMTNGTANNQLKRVKVVMGYASEQGLTQNTSFRQFKALRHTETDVVYLTREELDRLVHFDLLAEPRLARVRDLFVFACSTGLRHSDFSTVRPDQIKGNQVVVRTIKTRDWLYLDLNPYSRAVLERYPQGLPLLSQQKFNTYVKELGQYCGLDAPVQVVHYQGSQRIEHWQPKYELLSSHTGRRTFVTQSLERGMAPAIIMKFTGHKDIKTLMRYVKVADTEKRAQMEKAWG
ncbi:site-specific integrase [Hymenobacter persicinus]|uniref:Site-specific integrase n=1 Tax=Hymenobacter persicinus TaxID=2025506 RepID=A0A4Q5LFB4_9BACT|nr:site-specific integrase [Hymenobacter persicinus]RYU81835.1 site-specific integrase [Hymenobacter persicinus]